MEQARRKEQELDLELTYINNSNLARKTQIRRFPDQGQLRAAAGQGGRIRQGMGHNAQSQAEPAYQAQGEQDGGVRLHSGQRRDSGSVAQNRFRTGNTARQNTNAAAGEQVRRNPYLVDYKAQGMGGAAMDRTGRKRDIDDIDLIWGEERKLSGERVPQGMVPGQEARRRPVSNGSRQRPAAGASRQPLSAASRQSQRMGAASGAAVSRPQRRPGVSGTRDFMDGRDQRRQLQQERRRREALRRKLIMGIGEGVVLISLIVLLFVVFHQPKDQDQNTPAMNQQEETQPQNNMPVQTVQGFHKEVFDTHPAWTEDFLTVSEYSRPGEPLGEVKNIFVHYTANPGTSAKQNRSYFEQLKDTHERGASAHFIIGYEGEIIQCVPLDEVAYAVQTRNEDSISIECCYKSKDGSFTQETYDSLISLLAWLTDAYGLDSEDILRHYDCGGKKCPIYYTENEDAWERLKADVRDYTL